MRGLEEARALYETAGQELLNRFTDYAEGMAIGLAGRGSECFGYDDEISRDHDFQSGFCIWLDEETEREMGIELSRAYRELVPGAAAQRSAMAEKSRGVLRSRDFYRRYTGREGAPESWQDWLYLPSQALAEATNGQIWHEGRSSFAAARREILQGMPEDVRKKKLAARLVTMAQAGQYNYGRCLAHGEAGAAALALAEFVKAASEVVFLLNRRHMPYYKWQFRAMGELGRLSQLSEALSFLLTEGNETEQRRLKAGVIEDICAAVAGELGRQQLCRGRGDYMEPYAFELMESIENQEIRALHVMEG